MREHITKDGSKGGELGKGSKMDVKIWLSMPLITSILNFLILGIIAALVIRPTNTFGWTGVVTIALLWTIAIYLRNKSYET